MTAYFGKNVIGANLSDLDNDGDLDLMTTQPILLHLNNGEGIFVDRTTQLGVDEDVGGGLVLGDHDADGFLDVIFLADSTFYKSPSLGHLYRNNRNDNHYLRVETS